MISFTEETKAKHPDKGTKEGEKGAKSNHRTYTPDTPNE